MTNTRHSFHDKWQNAPELAFFEETLREGSDTCSWILTRNGFATAHDLREFLASRARVLDAGCGNGRVTALLRTHSDPHRTEITAVDLVAAAVARRNLDALGFDDVRVEAADLRGDLSSLGLFDFIYCQEVLHHTGDPRGAFHNLVKSLAPGGEIAIYVYRKKAPVREFVDDFVRARVADLGYEDAMAACAEITAFGRALSEVQAEVTVPEVKLLEIPAGTYHVQRLLYHFFAKCHWNPDLTVQENEIVNYDWYHPQDCTRHTPEEVRSWFDEAGLEIVHEHADFYGITVRGRAGTPTGETKTA